MSSKHRYSHHARRALTHARTLVQQFRHPRIDTGHLFVGVLLTQGSIGHQVLTRLALTEKAARPHLAALVLPLDAALDAPPNDAALDAALNLAADESNWLGHHYVGTEHLLLGITRTNVGNASDLMHRLGVSPERVRHYVRLMLDDGMTEDALVLARRSARLSELSRRVINAAEQVAVAQDSPAVGLGHLLLVLMGERRCSSPQLLARVRLEERRLRHALALGNADALASIDTLVAAAGDQARALGNHFTGTQHLLLAFTTDETGIRLLEALDVSADHLRDLVAAQLVQDDL